MTGYGQQGYGTSPYGMPELEETVLTAGDARVVLANSVGVANLNPSLDTGKARAARTTVSRGRSNPNQTIGKATNIL
jgi:hypothetical protein